MKPFTLVFRDGGEVTVLSDDLKGAMATQPRESVHYLDHCIAGGETIHVYRGPETLCGCYFHIPSGTVCEHDLERVGLVAHSPELA